MRKLLLALPVLTLLSGSSCKKVDELTEFDLNYASTQSIPASTVSTSATVDFISPDTETQSTQKFQENGTSKDLIDAVKLTSLRLSQTGQGNFDYLRSISVFMQADGLDEVLIATKASVPKGVSAFNLDVTGTNVKEYIFKDKIRFRMNLTVDSLPSKAQDIKMEQTLRVSGKKLSKK